MKRVMFCLLLGLGAVAFFSASSGQADPPEVRSNKDEVLARQKERRFVLRKAVKSAGEGFRNGVPDFRSVVRVNNSLLSAELDLAPDKAARIAAHERLVEVLKENERIANERAEAISEVEVLEAKAARLQAEIELLRESAN